MKDMTDPPEGYPNTEAEKADMDRLEHAAKTYQDLHDESGGELLARLGTDGSEWATEFALRFPGSPDIDTLRAWFANAIEAGVSCGHNRSMHDAHHSAAKLGVDLTEVYTIGHLVEVVHTHGHPKFQNARELDDYLQELNDRGEVHDGVPILDANKVVWLTYGEEHSSGGEQNKCHLLQGDPTDDITEEEVAEGEALSEDGQVVKSIQTYVPIPLSDAKYPVTLLYAPPAE